MDGLTDTQFAWVCLALALAALTGLVALGALGAKQHLNQPREFVGGDHPDYTDPDIPHGITGWIASGRCGIHHNEHVEACRYGCTWLVVGDPAAARAAVQKRIDQLWAETHGDPETRQA